MSITTSTQPMSTNPSDLARTPTHRRLRARRPLAALLALAVTALLGLMTAQPAAAASGMKVCFKTRTNLAVGNQLTYLDLWDGQWRAVALGNTNHVGCISYYITGTWQAYPARVRMASRSTNGDWFYGVSPWVGGVQNFYTLTVRPGCIGFCYGA